MKITAHAIPGVLTLEPQLFRDERGFFMESFNQRRFEEALGRSVHFVQDNHSASAQHVLRGLHYQEQHPQGKLVRVVRGEIFDVAVDIRQDSPYFGQWVAERLSADNHKQLWVPEGFAHGFLVLSEFAEVLYKTTDYWYAQHERSLRWDDPQLNIAWPVTQAPVLSAKDQQGLLLSGIVQPQSV